MQRKNIQNGECPIHPISYEYYQAIFARVPKPFAYIDLDLLDANIRSIASAAGSKRVRVASKSIRCVDVLRRVFDGSPVYQGIMGYTGQEAAFLLERGFDDVLLGYPAWDEEEILAPLRIAADEGRKVTFMADSVQHVQRLEALGGRLGIAVSVCLEIDMSVDYPGLHFGVYRSPIQSWAQAEPVVREILKSKWVKLDGLMGYEAQIAGVGDRMPGQRLKNRLIRLLKSRSIPEVARRRSEVLRGIERMGIPLRFVNAGGTGSMDSSRMEAGVTEITAGSGFYSPGLFDYYRGFRYLPAAGFALEVVRKPTGNIATCLGGGYVASGAVGKEKSPVPFLPSGLRLIPREGAGEVQTPLKCPEGLRLEIGDPVLFRHAKAGELCERFEKLYAVSQGEIVAEYPTYRGEGKCFL